MGKKEAKKIGGKSRKSGEVSKRLIDRLLKGTGNTPSCGSSNKKKSDRIPILFDMEKGGGGDK